MYRNFLTSSTYPHTSAYVIYEWSSIANSSSWREQAPKRKRASTNAQVFFYSYGVSSLKMKKNPNMSNFWRIKFFHQMFKVQVFLKGHKIWLHLLVLSGMLEGSKIREGGWVFLPPKQYIPPPCDQTKKSIYTVLYIGGDFDSKKFDYCKQLNFA